MVCGSAWTPDGCPNADFCIDHGYWLNGGDGMEGNGTYCYNHCPVTCMEHEILCKGHVDHATGCQMNGDHCIDSINYGFGFNNATGEYVDCPGFCWEDCNWMNGEHYCHGGFDENGCELPGFCAGEGSGDCPNGFKK